MSKILYYLGFILTLTFLGILGYLDFKVPKYQGNIDLNSISSEVHVYYDDFGVPHIEGENTKDVFRALGFVTASDRLFQMDLLRRIVSGRLSEIFGDATIEADILLRTLKIKETGRKQFQLHKEKFPKELIDQMQAYLDGVHEYIEKKPLPIEFDLLGYKPEKFTMEDMASISGYMGLTFAEGLIGDVVLSELKEKLPKAKLDILRSGAKTDINYFPSKKVVHMNFLDQIDKGLKQIENVFPLFHGSNSWVLSGSRTESGFPILGNDPHIAVSNPHIFFEAHIKTPDIEVYGNYIPLIPFPIMGHTPYSAWGITMAEVDDMTIYEEKINPENEEQVMFKGEWVKVEKELTEIVVKDSDSIILELRSTPHGPLLNKTKHSVEGKTLALSWSLYLDENKSIQSLYELPYAKTVDEFRVATSHATAPALNISWVNNTGDIAWWVLGRFPKLPEGVPYDLVLNGWSGEHEIEGFYEHQENPHEVNPESGVIITANYKPQQEEFKHFEGYWQPGGRYFRIQELLEQNRLWSLQSLKSVQLDSFIPIYTQLKEQMISLIDTKDLNQLEKQSLEILNKWNGESLKDSIASSIYHHLLYFVQVNIFKDELGTELYERFGKTAEVWHSMKELLFLPNHSFWDDVNTDRVENAKNIINKSFKQAVIKLSVSKGARAKNWAWGEFHHVTYEHPLGKVKPLNLLFNIGPIQANGGRYTINNIGHKRSSANFKVVHAPATRRLIDMQKPREAIGIIPTGNSGNFLSPHYSDQTVPYHNGEYRVQTMDWGKIRKSKQLILR